MTETIQNSKETYSKFLKSYFVVFGEIMSKVPVQKKENDHQKLRTITLEILHRLTPNELLVPHAKDICKITITTFQQNDSEDNACLCIKILTDLHKAFRTDLDNFHIQPFLDFALKLYQDFARMVHEHSSMDDKIKSRSGIEMDEKAKAELLIVPCQKSFKVLVEVPLLIVLFFQAFPNATKTIERLLGEMMKTFEVKWDLPPMGSQKRTHFVEYFLCQVKIVSFFAYALKTYPEQVKRYKEDLPRILTELLNKCPNEAVAPRREILVVMRHMIDAHNSDLRPKFIEFIDRLVDEKILIGTSIVAHETLRPLAYSTLADIVHHIRKNLTMNQLAKAVSLFIKVMLDNTIIMSIHIMCGKLLTHLIESIFKLREASKTDDTLDTKSVKGTKPDAPEKDFGKVLLYNIMSAFINKMKSHSKVIEQISKDSKKDDDDEGPKQDAEGPTFKSCRMLVQTLILGLKNIAFILLSDQTSSGKYSEDMLLFSKLFKYGLNCFPVIPNNSTTIPNDEKDNLDAFAGLYAYLPQKNFQEVFKQQLPLLYSKILVNQNFMIIPTHFLAHTQVSNYFSEILLTFLIERMEKMSGNGNEQSVLLRLFKLIFGSIVTFPNNEGILKPHLTTIVNQCLNLASTTKDSTNYFLTLRALFRSVVGGKFEGLYKEFTNLLPAIMEKLTDHLKSSQKSSNRDLFIELCLTIPAKLQYLAPFLSILIRPVLYALEGNHELVGLGLRNLDLWIDSMRPDSLEPILKPVMSELLSSLFSHLKPPPYAHGMSSMKILAKLAGLNRKFLSEPVVGEINEHGEDSLYVKLRFGENQEFFDFPLDRFIKLARRVFYSAPDIQSREQSFDFLKACLVCMIKVDGDLVEDFKIPDEIGGPKTYKSNLTIYASNNFFDPYNVENKDFLPKTQEKINSEALLFRKLLTTMFIALGDENLKVRAQPFVNGLCRHFALLMIAQCKHVLDPMRELNPDIFFDALIEVFSHEKLETDKIAAEQTLEEFIRVVSSICVHKDFMLQSLVWEKLASRLSHCCHQREWYKKLGGCKGIFSLCKSLPSQWVKRHESDFVKALLFIIKDSSPQVAVYTVDEARLCLEMLIKTCHEPFPEVPDEKSKLQKDAAKRLHELLLILVSELSSSHDIVRHTVRNLIQMVSKIVDKPATTLLQPFQASLNNSIVVNRFKSLPPQLQTGFCDAVTFFLSLDPPLLTLSDQILLIIEKALTIFTRQKDESHQTSSDQDKKNQVALKMACMRLLKEALNTKEMCDSTKNPKIRDKIVEVFFKFLSSVNKEVIDVAKSGLSGFIAQQKIPKDLLQNSLRPILSNLGAYTKLTMQFLQTLAHLLELCTTYFSVKLGEQLLDHRKQWITPNKITHLEKSEQVPAAVHILKLFSLLPKESSKFLTQLVPTTLQLEKAWKGYFSEYASPFRKALTEFLAIYPQDTIGYFLGNKSKGMVGTIIRNEELFGLFVSILKFEEAQPIVRGILDQPDTLVFSSFLIPQIPNISEEMKIDINYKQVQLINIFMKKDPDFLKNNRIVLDELYRLWLSKVEIKEPISYDSPIVLLTKILIKCFVSYCRVKKEEIDLLFTMLTCLHDPSVVTDYSFLREFYQEEIWNCPPEKKRNLIEKYLDVFKDPNSNIKLEALSLLVLGPLRASIAKKEDVLDDKLMERIFKEMFVDNNKFDEPLRTEIIQLAIVIVKNFPTKIVNYRKEILMFAYQHLKSDEITAKFSGAILVANFVEAFESPEATILQLLNILLKSKENESKNYVKQAFDILIPCLNQRMKTPIGEVPKWVKLFKKLIMEEGHHIPHLIHIMSIVAKHPDVFFPHRDVFLMSMIHSLSRIGLPSNSPVENKKLTIDLVEVMLNWITKANSEHDTSIVVGDPSVDSKKRKIMSEKESNKKSKSEDTPYQDIGELLINSLYKLTFHNEKRNEAGSQTQMIQIGKRCVEMLRKALELFPKTQILVNVDQLIAIDKKSFDPNSPCIELEMLKVALDCKQSNVLIPTSSTFYGSFSHYLSYLGSQHVLGSVLEFLKSFLIAFPISDPSNVEGIQMFYSNLLEALREVVTRVENLPADTDPTTYNVFGHLNVLKIIFDAYPETIAPFSHLIFKVFSRFVKDHLHATHSKMKAAHQQNLAKQSQQKQQVSQQQMIINSSTGNELHVPSILLCVDMLCMSTNDITIRKGFLTTITQMIDKTNEINNQVMSKVLHNVIKWIFGNEAVHKLNPKEKVFFTSKISVFEHNPINDLKNIYYDFLVDVYANPSIAAEDRELKEKIETTFMYGLKSENFAIREKFLNLLNNKIGKTVHERMAYIFANKNWEPLGDNFWIRHAVDFLFAILANDDKVTISKDAAVLFSIIEKSNSSNTPQGRGEDEMDEEKPPVLSEEGTRPKELSEEGKSLLVEHSKFLNSLKTQTVSDILKPLRDLSRESIRFSYEIWTSLFSYAWNALKKDQKDEIHKSMNLLLTREYHSKQYNKYPNVVQAILEGVARVTPKIHISPEILKFLGRSFRGWHIVIPMLEEQLETLKISKNVDPSELESVSSALCEIYRLLGEDSVLSGVWKSLNVSEQSRNVLSLEQHGMWLESQETLKEAIQQFQKGEIPKNSIGNNELSLWEDHWIQTSKKLQQWDELTKYAKQSESTPLMLETFWQNSDWKSMKELFSKHSVSENQMLKIYQISNAIMEDKGKEGLDYLLSATQMALQKWCTLPQFSTNAHLGMLHNFQQLLELHDSSRFLTDFSRYTQNDIKVFFSSWRERLPNKFDDINQWNEILTWRHHFLIHMSKKPPVQGGEPHQEFCLNEAVWTLNKLAKIARKQNLSQAALGCLSESKKLLAQIKPETPEQFVRVYEVLSCYMKDDKLSLAAETFEGDKAIPKLKAGQKSDVQRIRGELYARLGKKDEAYKTFSSTVSVYTSDQRFLQNTTHTGPLSKTFYYWAKLLDQQVLDTDHSDITMIENTIVCYMQGIRYGNASSRHLISRILYLLTFDDDKFTLQKTMEKCIVDTPVWVWLPWIHNLISMISKRDCIGAEMIAKIILTNIGKKFPQAIYYNMRSFYFELREEVKGATPSTTLAPGSPGVVPSLTEPKKEETESSTTPLQRIKKHSEEMMANVLTHFQPMVQETESMLKELGVKLKPEPEEDLQRMLESILRFCYKRDLEKEVAIPQAIQDMIIQLVNNEIIFPKEDVNSPQQAPKNSSWIRENRTELFSDLKSVKTLKDILGVTRKWVTKTQTRLWQVPSVLPIENLSRYLADFQGIEVEIPGQYCTTDDREPYMEQHEKIYSFLPQIELVRRNKVTSRRVSIRSHSGKLYKFLLQPIAHNRPIGLSRSEERAWNLLFHINRILDKDKVARKQQLRLHWPVVVPLSHKMRFIQERPTYSSFEDVLHEHCLVAKMNVDTPYIKYWNGGQDRESLKDLLPADLLTKFIHLTCPSWNEFFMIRKQFSIQTGIFSLMSYLLNVTDRNLHKILIGKNTGDIFHFDFRPTLDTTGGFDRNKEAVPFRLTKNMTNLISVYNMEGPLMNSMSVTANSFVLQSKRFEHLMQLYLQDELTSWQSNKSGIITTDYFNEPKLLRSKIKDNMGDIWKKLEPLPPKFKKDDGITISEGVSALIKSATSVENLNKMPPTWYPWW